MASLSALDEGPSFALAEGSCGLTTLARLGAARFGRSGVGDLSMASSREAPGTDPGVPGWWWLLAAWWVCRGSSSESRARLPGRAAAWATEEASWWKAAGLVWPGVGEGLPQEGFMEEEEAAEEEGACRRPNPKPKEGGACGTGLGWKSKLGWRTLAMMQMVGVVRERESRNKSSQVPSQA